MRTLRIGLLMHSVNPRGGVIHTLELARALQSFGHDVTVMAVAHPRQQLFRPVTHRFEIAPVEAPGPDLESMVRTRIDAYVRHLSAAARYADFDVLHAQDGIGANALANLTDRGLIPGYAATVHHIDHYQDERVNELQRRAIRRAGLLFCVSQLWQQHLFSEYGAQAVLVCNGVDLDRFNSTTSGTDNEVARRLGLRPGAPLIVSIGGIEPRKNTRRLLQAFQLLRRRHPGAQWAIVGGASLLDHSDYQAAFGQELADSGLHAGAGGDVVLTGVLADADLPALMRLADVLAFPSVHEGFGLVVIEALACGTPVAISRVAPFTEYLRDTGVAWAEPDDPYSIAAALQRALQTPHSALTPEVCRTFSWTRSASLHVAHYRQWLIAGESSCPPCNTPSGGPMRPRASATRHR
jgi:glycosyltransferase-like protein